MTRPRIRLGGWIAFLAIASGLGAISQARAAATAPEWLRSAAQETLPEYPKETVAVVLLDARQTTVKDNGEIETLYRRAVRILRPEARRDFGEVAAYFDSETKISYMKAWTISSDGHEIALNDKDTTESSLYDEIEFTDDRVKVLKFAELNPGSVIGYEYVQKQRPYMFEDDWDFQDKVPVRRALFILQLPPTWEFSTRWINYGEQQAQDSGPNMHTWELKDIPAIEIEPAMPPWHSIAGRLGVKYFPHDPTLRSKTDASWKDMGLWYAALTQSSRNSTPQIKQKVAELTSGIADPLAKMRALTEYVQQQIRYFAIEIGIGGFQPHPAGDVFTHQYGDCKDKATLLSAMLHEIGIESYYVIIDTHRGIVRPDYPSLRFNHAILAIRLPDDVPDGGLFATVTHPTLGRLLFFDPTNEYVPLGYLPSYLQDNYGLVVTPEGGELLSLPLLPPSTNRLIRTAKFSLDATGNLSGEVREIRWGGPAADGREEFQEASPAKRAEFFENFLGNFLNNFTLNDAAIGGLDQFDGNLSLDYKFVAQGYAKMAGNLLIVRPRVLGEKGWDIVGGKPRKYPIEFEEATRQDDVFDITLPAGYVVDDLPAPVDVDCEYGSYRSEVQVSDGVLHYKRTYEIKDIVVPTLKLYEVKNFLQQIAEDENSSAVLRRVSP
ncbi:MAG: DUF3857 domain-containing transglutaminase family protein [Candidatus Acidiferrales bacterium]